MENPRYSTERHTDATRLVSRWDAYLYANRLSRSPGLQSAVALTQRALQKHGLANGNAAEAERLGRLADAFGRETFARLYSGDDNVELLEKAAAGTEWVTKTHDMLGNLAEYDALARQVHGDPDLAARATERLLYGICAAIPEVAEEEKKAAERAEKEAKGRRVRGEKPDPDAVMRRSLRQAADDAGEDAAKARAALDGLHAGLGATPAIHEQDGAGRMELAEKITSDPRMQKIMQLAGRMRRMADAGRPQRDEHGCTTLVGVTIGGDLPRALPTELGLLRHKSMRRIQLAKIADRRLQQYHLVGETPLGRGPTVVLVDESSSMCGDRHLWASAIALGCLNISAKEGRACTVIGFNSGIRWCVGINAKGEGLRYQFSHTYEQVGAPERMGGFAEVAMHIASSRPCGGTSFDAPLTAALQLEDGLTVDRADLVLITDGHATASQLTLDGLNDAKEEGGMRVFGMTIGGGSFGKDVAQICDHTIDLDNAINDDDASGIAGVMP